MVIGGVLAGCIGVETTWCGWGFVCPAGTVCEPIHGACVLPEQLEACRGLNELEACHFTGSAPGYRCRFGVCVLPYCGDGVVDPEEECDEGRNNMDVPNANCRRDCLSRQCGDGIRDDYEECDGHDLGGYDCASLGMDGGELGCGAGCHFDTSSCWNVPECGNGILDAGEACDDGNLVGMDGCSPTCRRATGTFTRMGVPVSAPGELIGLACADVDGDGLDDLVSGTAASGLLRVHLSNGDGTFRDSEQSPIGENCTTGWNVTLADLDEDGVADIVSHCRQPDGVNVARGLGDGLFEEPVLFELAGDANPEGMAIADFDGDGLQDVVLSANRVDPVWTFWGTGDGSLMEATPFSLDATYYATQSVAAHFDADSWVDLAIARNDGLVTIFYGDGTSAFAGRPQLDVPVDGQMIVGMASADVDQDGNTDIIVGHNGNIGQVSVLLGDGMGGFVVSPTSPIPMEDGDTAYVVGIATGHLDGDGNLDLALCHHSAATVLVFRGDGVGGFESAMQVDVGGEARMPAVCDVNGDGISDLVAAVQLGAIEIFLGDYE